MYSLRLYEDKILRGAVSEQVKSQHSIVYVVSGSVTLNGEKIEADHARYFADLDKNPELKGWIMDSEPENGLAWTEECGSAAEEKVHAWMPMDNIEIADLPEGVESRNFESMEV